MATNAALNGVYLNLAVEIQKGSFLQKNHAGDFFNEKYNEKSKSDRVDHSVSNQFLPA